MLQQLRCDTDLEKSNYLEKQLWEKQKENRSQETGGLQSKRGIKGRDY